MKQQKHSYSDCLTNEELYKQYQGSQFDIVNKAIMIAEHQVRAGKDSMDIDVDNIAYETLGVLADHGLNAFSEE